jgi:hypothetical protein
MAAMCPDATQVRLHADIAAVVRQRVVVARYYRTRLQDGFEMPAHPFGEDGNSTLSGLAG